MLRAAEHAHQAVLMAPVTLPIDVLRRIDHDLVVDPHAGLVLQGALRAVDQYGHSGDRELAGDAATRLRSLRVS